MAISRKEMKKYFEIFGFDVDDASLSLGCFKCGEYLYYKNRKYKCDNNHKWKYQAMVFEHADMMKGLVDSAEDKKVCCL